MPLRQDKTIGRKNSNIFDQLLVLVSYYTYINGSSLVAHFSPVRLLAPRASLSAALSVAGRKYQHIGRFSVVVVVVVVKLFVTAAF